MLSTDEIARVRAEHRLVEVLARAGVELSREHSRSVMVSCPLPGHDDATPSMVVHLDTDRYHCFGCGAHGDVLQLVVDLEGISSLSRAAEVLDSRRALRAFPSSGTRASLRTGTSHGSTGVEQPDLSRTDNERVLEVNAAAWDFLTEASRAQRARRYLSRRGIDLRALEDETGRPLAGHSPASRTGLGEHLLGEGFTRAELVDAGWVSASSGRPLLDRCRGRVLLAARDEDDRVIGVYARDVTGRSGAKDLNTPDTVVYHKGRVFYRPVSSDVTGDTTVVVCEGSLDALAIAATAAAAGRSSIFAPVAASGTALTANQAQVLLHLSDGPPVLCGDGDGPGLRATATWATAILREHRECLTTVLPDGLDPAEWLARHGEDGLGAFSPRGDGHDSSSVRPRHPGAVIATAICTELRQRGFRDTTIATVAVRRLGGLGKGLVRPSSRQRFALDATRALATEGLGVASVLGSEVSDARDRGAESVGRAGAHLDCLRGGDPAASITPVTARALETSRAKSHTKAPDAPSGDGRSRPRRPLPELVDIATVAASLGVGVRHVRRLVAEGRIPFVKVGHYVRFDPDDVSAWVNERRVEALRTRWRPELGGVGAGDRVARQRSDYSST